MEPKQHWESIHAESEADDVSWHQEEPRLSLMLLERLGVPPDARVLDVGTGISGLAGHLARRGWTRVTSLDISGEALRKARARLGADGDRVTWLEADVLTLDAPAAFDAWHDRAVFHFFTEPAQQAAYARVVARSLAPGGVAILATFAPDGPEKCSGLPVARHSPESLARVLGPDFRLVERAREEHRTPWGAVQAFTWAAFRRA